MEDCLCGQAWEGEGDSTGDFAAVREACPVLRHLVLPDDTWPSFLETAREPHDPALHRSILLLAFERGHLGRVTSPLHRYLFVDGHPRSELRKEYARALRERWILESDLLKRHREARRFMGRLVELQCAEWLEANSWRIRELEALREGPDIEAEGELHGHTAFEVKYLGQEDSDFEAVVESLAGKPSVQTGDLYGAVNYLVFRVYQAAKQLQEVKARRAVLFVVNALTWHTVALQLEHKWIDWTKPRFYEAEASKRWREFLETQRKRYPDAGERVSVPCSFQSEAAPHPHRRTVTTGDSCVARAELSRQRSPGGLAGPLRD
jgi:hypothetical protein